MACQQGTLTLPDTLFRPFWTCICSHLLQFSQTCRDFPNFSPVISFSIFPILLITHVPDQHSLFVIWPYTMTTPYWSDFIPNSTFYRILSGFHRTFATGVACRQGTLTPPDTWSRPFRTCICSTCWDQSFSELVVILPDYALRISLGTFSILLDTSQSKTSTVTALLRSFLSLYHTSWVAVVTPTDRPKSVRNRCVI